MGGGGGLSTEDCLRSSDCSAGMTLLLHLGTEQMKNFHMYNLNAKHISYGFFFYLELNNIFFIMIVCNSQEEV